jgi:NitT/TauT family transport system permease protein
MTGLEALAGLSLALLFATSAMILISINPGLLRFILPPMILSQVIPLITIAPLLIVIIGIGVQSKIIMAAIISFFPIFINLAVSVRDIPTGFQEMTTLYRPNWLFKVRHLYLPLSLPSLMASLRVAATLSVIGAIVAEFTGAEIGLGKNLFLAMRRLEPELMMSSIILSALLGSGLYLAIVLVERSVGRWYLR